MRPPEFKMTILTLVDFVTLCKKSEPPNQQVAVEASRGIFLQEETEKTEVHE